MGSPITHSLSPALHRTAYAGLGLDGWTYDALEVDADALPAALEGLSPEWVGVSLTMPLKHAVLPLLDEVSELARAVGAVNTLTLADGRRIGDNTDVHGIVAALDAAGVTDVGGAVVVGGGATAASAVAALLQLGEAAPVVVARSPDRCGPLLAAAARLDAAPRVEPWSAAGRLLAQAPVVVSTVPPGVADELLPPGSSVSGVLLDVVYRPWPTPLAAGWAAAGGVAVPGLEMLLHQAARQVLAWTGRSPDLGAMRSAALAELAARSAG
jgi:shikimate dehydrogenase